MVAEYLQLHPVDPQPRLIRQAADIVRRGGLIAYPTDSCYALGWHLGDTAALERVRRIRQADRHHHFTLVCAIVLILLALVLTSCGEGYQFHGTTYDPPIPARNVGLPAVVGPAHQNGMKPTQPKEGHTGK